MFFVEISHVYIFTSLEVINIHMGASGTWKICVGWELGEHYCEKDRR